MNLKELSVVVAKKHNLTNKQARDVIKTFTETVVASVAKGQKASIGGFGVFDKVTRKARKGRNPHTGEALKIPARIVPKFSASKNFKTAIVAKKRGKKTEV